MGGLLAIVLPLALGAAVTPTIVAMQLLTLSGRSAPLRRAWPTAAGYWETEPAGRWTRSAASSATTGS